MAIQDSIKKSKLIVVDSTTQFRFVVVPGAPIRLGILIDKPTNNLRFDLEIVAQEPLSFCEVKILSILADSDLELVGRLVIKKGASFANLSLTHDTILLGNGAKVSTKPELVIQEDSVKCGHGATVSTLDARQVAYCESRGITRQNAENMLCSSKIQTICDWVSMKSEEVRSQGQ